MKCVIVELGLALSIATGSRCISALTGRILFPGRDFTRLYPEHETGIVTTAAQYTSLRVEIAVGAACV